MLERIRWDEDEPKMTDEERKHEDDLDEALEKYGRNESEETREEVIACVSRVQDDQFRYGMAQGVAFMAECMAILEKKRGAGK